MSQIKCVRASKREKAARAERFAEALPPPPKKQFAHPEGAKIRVSDNATVALLKLCHRRLLKGEELTPPQLAALERAGVTPDDILDGKVEGLGGEDMAAPSIYFEHGIPVPKLAPAAGAGLPLRRGRSASAASTGEIKGEGETRPASKKKKKSAEDTGGDRKRSVSKKRRSPSSSRSRSPKARSKSRSRKEKDDADKKRSSSKSGKSKS
jgi:hypothetical protein